ncbi:MAG: ATP-dependent RecD-like DNA helicase [Oscillospiraceae bacterium]|nr:ATP-dependent RecD-like DNA helicase [Oscillospiraceae bacterium]
MKDREKLKLQQLLNLQGVIENIIFHSEQTGFTVVELDSNGELVTMVGELPDLSCGEEIIATGTFVAHPTYGRQFKAQAIEHVTPATETAILRYLSGGAIKGIGPMLAQRIVKKFGDKALEIMDTDPEALAQIKGISLSKAIEIGKNYTQLLGVRSIMAFLSAYDIEPAASIAAYKKWGAMTRELVMADPFLLCDSDIAVDFEKADRIAESLGMGTDAPCRIRGGIKYVLEHNLNNGHCCLPLDKMTDAVCGFLDTGRDQTLDMLDEMVENGQLISDEIDSRQYIYLPEQHRSECYCADRLAMMMRFPPQDRPVDEDELYVLERELGISYAEKQRQAICSAVSNQIMILTGGPGTGKTTTLNGIITLFERRAMKVMLAAPTGRAAKRLSEVTGREAKTIHRMLEVDFAVPGDTSLRFKRNERNPLAADAVIVDEMSMVDASLFASLLKAVRTTSRLVLVGDPDQLPSVGAGNVLKDLIDCERLECIHLNEVFRQAANSLIITSAHEIVAGRMPQLGRTDRDMFFLGADPADSAAATVTDLCARRLPKAYGYSPLRDIQVIIPTKQGMAGTIELNRRLQAALNPPDQSKCECTVGQMILREGDKVMQIRNNYDVEWQRADGEEGLGIFNGDIGIVDMIDRPSRSAMITFDDRRAMYTFDMLGEIDLAYAITAHKSQGNEFEAVVMPLLGRHKKLHYRNLLYTAVTRAKKLLIIVGQRQTVEAMVENDKKTLRYTNLSSRIRKELENIF